MCRCIFIRIANNLWATNEKQDSDLATDPQAPGCGVAGPVPFCDLAGIYFAAGRAALAAGRTVVTLSSGAPAGISGVYALRAVPHYFPIYGAGLVDSDSAGRCHQRPLTIGHAIVAPVARRAALYWGVVAADLFFAARWCQLGHVPVLAGGV